MFLDNGPMTSIFSIPPPGSYASSHPVFPIELCSLNDIFSWHLCFHKRKTPTKKPLSDVFIFKIMEILLYNMFLRERWGKILENHWVKKRVFFSFWNQQWHWSLETVGHCICHGSYAEFSRKGNPEPGRMWCKNFSSIFVQFFQAFCSEMHSHISGHFLEWVPTWFRPKRKQKNQTQDCSVQWDDGSFYPRFNLNN